jgi:hypothetical protein
LHDFEALTVAFAKCHFEVSEFKIVIKLKHYHHSISEVKQRLVWSLFGWAAAGEIASQLHHSISVLSANPASMLYPPFYNNNNHVKNEDSIKILQSAIFLPHFPGQS